MKGKVSLITPCYNGSKYIDLYISNVTSQVYPNIEVIFVDDGSTDEINEKYDVLRETIEKRGYEFILIRKENGGVASAINCGLKRVTGDYIMLLDMDDELFEGAVSEKASILDKNLDCDIVISNGYYIFEDSKRRKCPFVDGKKVRESDIFINMLKREFYNWPGSYMVRKNSFEKMNGGMEIYESPYGQNLQMIFPVLCGGKVIFTDKYLMNYWIRKSSLSHTNDNNKMERNIDGFEDIRKTVISGLKIDKDEKEKYLRILEIAGAREKLRFACRIYDKVELKRQYDILNGLNAVSKDDIKIYMAGHYKITVILYKIINKINIMINHKAY